MWIYNIGPSVTFIWDAGLFDLYHYDFNIHGHHHNNLDRKEGGKLTKKHRLVMLKQEYKSVNLVQIFENAGRRC